MSRARPSRRMLLKLGGAALQSETVLAETSALIAGYRRHGWQVVMVHGGGPAINEELTARGIKWNFVNGQRVTTPEMMDAIELALWGKVNRLVVRELSAAGIPVKGFSGADRELLFCAPASPELGLVGQIRRVNADWLEDVFSSAEKSGGVVPVIAPLGCGESGLRFNINADWAASYLAVALRADEVLFLTDQPGILDESARALARMDSAGLRGLIERGVVTGGMLTKVRSVLNALEGGVKKVRIGKAGQGTLCESRFGDSSAHTVNSSAR